MVYEAEMIEIARRCKARWGSLKEVIFLEANKNSLLVFSKITIPSRDLPETDMLAFGYSGTGSQCYATFLDALGFKRSGVSSITTPSKLKKDGTIIKGIRREAQWSLEVSGSSLNSAKKKIKKPDIPKTCILYKEILSDGTPTTKTIFVDTESKSEAIEEAKSEIPSGSDIIKINVQNKIITKTEKFEALDKSIAIEEAKNSIDSWESSYKSLSEVTCVKPPRRGFLGIGKKLGEFEAKYKITGKQVEIQYRPPAEIKVHYGPKKLKCTKCNSPMDTTTKGVRYVGGRPSPESALIKLRCEKCDITRFEKKWEIEGEWIEWKDGSKKTIL